MKKKIDESIDSGLVDRAPMAIEPFRAHRAPPKLSRAGYGPARR